MSIQELFPSQPLPRFAGIENDSQSGVILKILSDAKFTPRTGGTYRIYHIPQSNDFTVEENWSETGSDGIITPRKKYTHFTITSNIPPISEPVPNQPRIPGTSPTPEPEQPDHHEKIPSLEPDPLKNPLPVEKPGSFEISPDREPKPRQKTSLEILTEKFKIGRQQIENNIVPDPIIPDTIHETPDKEPTTAEPSMKPNTPENSPLSLLNTIYGPNQEEWRHIENMPFDTFMHPENYYWGTDTFGKPIEHTFSDYPERSQKLHQLLVEKNISTDFSEKPLKEVIASLK